LPLLLLSEIRRSFRNRLRKPKRISTSSRIRRIFPLESDELRTACVFFFRLDLFSFLFVCLFFNILDKNYYYYLMFLRGFLGSVFFGDKFCHF
jgi:hypothetical protein